MLVFFIFFFVVCHEFKKGFQKMKFSDEIRIENSCDHNAMIKIIKIENRKYNRYSALSRISQALVSFMTMYDWCQGRRNFFCTSVDWNSLNLSKIIAPTAPPRRVCLCVRCGCSGQFGHQQTKFYLLQNSLSEFTCHSSARKWQKVNCVHLSVAIKLVWKHWKFTVFYTLYSKLYETKNYKQIPALKYLF